MAVHRCQERTVQKLLEAGMQITGQAMYALTQVVDRHSSGNAQWSRQQKLDEIFLPHVSRITESRELINTANASLRSGGFADTWRQLKLNMAPLMNRRVVPAPDNC